MAIMPDYMRLTPAEQQELDGIQAKARQRHEKARKAAAKQGRSRRSFAGPSVRLKMRQEHEQRKPPSHP